MTNGPRPDAPSPYATDEELAEYDSILATAARAKAAYHTLTGRLTQRKSNLAKKWKRRKEAAAKQEQMK